MKDALKKAGAWVSTTSKNWMDEYEASQRNKQERQQQYMAQQQRLAMLEPAAIHLDQFQQTNIANCFQAYGPVPTSALPPLALTPEQSLHVTGHMLRQFVIKPDHVETQQAIAILIQGGMMNLGPIWHGLYQELYQTLVAQFVDIPFDKAITQPYLEVLDTPKYVLYRFKYNIGSYSGAQVRQLQRFCTDGILTGPVLAMRQRYGLSNISIGWDDTKKQLVVGVC